MEADDPAHVFYCRRRHHLDGGFQGHDLMFHRAVWKPTIQHMCLSYLSGHRREQLHHWLEKRLTTHQQVTESRLLSGRHPILKYWLNKIRHHILCRQCGRGEGSADHASQCVLERMTQTTPTVGSHASAEPESVID